jgi:hypothetical protein
MGFHYNTSTGMNIHEYDLYLVGSPKPDRSKEMSQTKNDTLVLQVGGWAWV